MYRMMALALVSSIAFAIPHAEAATYYVDTSNSAASDSNSGSQSAPWRTIGKAASTLAAGDTAIVLGGTYNEDVSLTRSGTSDARITLRASGRVVTRTFSVSGSYVTIDGFELTNGGMNTIRGTGNHLLNNLIHDTGPAWGSVDISGTGHLIKGNRYYSSTGPGDDKTAFILHGTNHVVEDNEIGPAKDIDVFRAWGTGHVIRGNYIHDATLSSGSSAHMDVLQTFGVNCGTGCQSSLVFEQNLIVNAPQMQMFMSECNSFCSTMGPWEIRNNVYVNVGGQANFGIRNIRFSNNTLYNSGAANNLLMYLYDATGKSDYSGARIKNNIFIVPVGVSRYGQVISQGSTGSNVEVSNNYIAVVGGYGSVSGFNDPGGINGGDPRFANPGANDFGLRADSPAIGRGVTLPGYTNDFQGHTRTDPWDMGAFEFGSGPDPGGPPPAPTNLRISEAGGSGPWSRASRLSGTRA